MTAFEQKYPHLCQPITLAGTTFRNRMFSAPMGGTDITNDGCIGPKSVAFYELRAKGGAGAVTVSAFSTRWLPPPMRPMRSAATGLCLRWNCPTPVCSPVPT